MRRGYLKGKEKASRGNSRKKGFVFELPLNSQELVKVLRDNIHQFAMEAAVVVARNLLEDEVRQLCGVRYEHDSRRGYVRYGSQSGVISVGGQKVGIEKPRVRSKNGEEEVVLERYRSFQGYSAMPSAVMKRLVRGVSTRDYEGVIDLACDGFGVDKSSVSRHFVRGSREALKELRERRFEGARFAAILIDGVEFADEPVVAAVGVDEQGHKRLLGLRHGATENAEVCTSLLEDITERGLDSSLPTLFIIDGGKALSKAIKRVFGKMAFIQRCQVHKKRNIRAHLSDELWEEVSRRLRDAYNEENYGRALQKLKTTYKWLQRIAPDAAASLAEGMEETLTVVRLAIPPLLRKSLCSTNIIESAFYNARRTTRRVKRWRQGDMRLRWCAAGLLRAEQGFHRLKGYRQIPLLLEALNNTANQQQLDGLRKAA